MQYSNICSELPLFLCIIRSWSKTPPGLLGHVLLRGRNHGWFNRNGFGRAVLHKPTLINAQITESHIHHSIIHNKTKIKLIKQTKLCAWYTHWAMFHGLEAARLIWHRPVWPGLGHHSATLSLRHLDRVQVRGRRLVLKQRKSMWVIRLLHLSYNGAGIVGFDTRPEDGYATAENQYNGQ